MRNSKTMDKRIFELARVTYYSIPEILNFIRLTGASKEKAAEVLKDLSRSGVSDLKDINTSIKLGYFKIIE